jgi:hypothetical protein
VRQAVSSHEKYTLGAGHILSLETIKLESVGQRPGLKRLSRSRAGFGACSAERRRVGRRTGLPSQRVPATAFREGVNVIFSGTEEFEEI